jgi:hypothetical protein
MTRTAARLTEDACYLGKEDFCQLCEHLESRLLLALSGVEELTYGDRLLIKMSAWSEGPALFWPEYNNSRLSQVYQEIRIKMEANHE